METITEQLKFNFSRPTTVEVLVHSDGEINDSGHNLLVLVNQPSTGITDAYMTMLHADYDDLIEDHYGNVYSEKVNFQIKGE